jgi:hypothetical protein
MCPDKSSGRIVYFLGINSWRMASNGAEPIRPDTLYRFAQTFATTGFRPHFFKGSYGLAENTLCAQHLWIRHHCLKVSAIQHLWLIKCCPWDLPFLLLFYEQNAVSMSTSKAEVT